MTTEEKAKAYNKALERAKKQLEEAKVFDYEEGQIAHDIRTTTYAIFPELKESEDEKMLRTIIRGFENWKSNGMETFNNTKVDDILAYLEKQKINTEGDFGRGYDCGYKACLNSHGAEFFEKQKEQKPADSVEEEYIENRNDGTYTCATTNDGFDAYMNGFNTGYEEGKIALICDLRDWIKEQNQKTITL